MTRTKRRLSLDHDGLSPVKRQHRQGAIPNTTTTTTTTATAYCISSRDVISTMSDELLVRICSYMDVYLLLNMALVSRRFHAVASDSQLWRPHYYRRFVLPRAHRIPSLWPPGERSSNILTSSSKDTLATRHSCLPTWRQPPATIRWSRVQDQVVHQVDWKKQYRLRHNWARGRCAVEEVDVHDTAEKKQSTRPPKWQTLVKVVQGIAVTADSVFGLRAWELRTRQSIAQAPLESDKTGRLRPSCLAVDDAYPGSGQIDVAVGFEDGTSGIWRLDAPHSTLRLIFRQEKSFLGRLAAIAYGYPYLLTATQLGSIALFSFNNPSTDSSSSDAGEETETEAGRPDVIVSQGIKQESATLPPPYLVISLKSHTTRAPLALSLRKNASSVVASIAYTFSTVSGWSIGIQDLYIRSSDTVTSRVASSLPMSVGGIWRPWPESGPLLAQSRADADNGPTRLRYSHPYLLATLPDNTLYLYLCTSTATSLSISPGTRLWGHTSAISDADITQRGKAVSVSMQGDEIRIWELEGRVGDCSVEVRPREQDSDLNVFAGATGVTSDTVCRMQQNLGLGDGRRNWVGFDEEVVLVLKEASDGRDSLMLYDFT